VQYVFYGLGGAKLRAALGSPYSSCATVLRKPLNTSTVVNRVQNGQILFIRLYWTN